MRSLLLVLAGYISMCTDTSQAICQAGYVNLGGRCFVFLKDARINFLEGRLACQDLGGDLPIIKDCNLLGEISNHIIKSVDLAVVNDYWVGASDAAREGFWEWIDGTRVKLNTSFWGRVNDEGFNNEPSAYVDSCVLLRRGDNYLFSNSECTTSGGIKPICQHADSLLCPSPYVRVGSTCLLFIERTEYDWHQARTSCKLENGDLAIINDCQLMNQIIDHIHTKDLFADVGFWVGGTNSVNGADFKWWDGTAIPLGVPFWGKEGEGDIEPNNGGTGGAENCASLHRNSRWRMHDLSCLMTQGMGTLCEMPPMN